VPLIEALRLRGAEGASLRALFGLGWTFGLAFFLVGVHWIALLSPVAITVPWLKYPAWLAAAAYLAVFPGLMAVLWGWLTRRGRVPEGAAFVLAFFAVEELRASGELGFPWFQPGYTQHAYAPLIQMAALGGISLVTVWVLALNVFLWHVWVGPARGRWVVVVVLALALPWAWGSRALDAAPQPTGPAVALIQANVQGEIKWSGKHQPEILATFLDLTERAARDTARPVLAIWPETATGSYLRRQPDQAAAVIDLVARTGVPVFAGYPEAVLGEDGRPRYYNAAGLLSPTDDGTTFYAKRHLVPFGERMPFQSVLPMLGRLELGQAEWTPGRQPVLFLGGTGRFSCLVCFEAIFPDLARDDVRRGATWLVNVTNDEWFGNSAALYQHAAMSVFRSVENHVPLARCANTGLTLMTDSNGRVIAQAPVWSPQVLVARLAPPGPTTWFTRLGDWPGLVCALLLAIVAVRAAARVLTARAKRS
jgi:apolipoprotein N-acyltransferase